MLSSSSSSLRDTVDGSSNTIYPHHQHLQESTYSHIFSDHNAGYLLHHPDPVVQDADDHVPNNSGRVTIVTPSLGKTVMNMPEPAVPMAKKKSDNRSKIRTAQGLRDRRVRLSTGIARKFFDLQDLLRFDKPSRTLEWLLTHSNKAILELSAACSSSSTSSQGTAATGVAHGYKGMCSSRSTTAYSNNQAELLSCNAALKTMKRKAQLVSAKESREKARARARARTAAKLHTATKLLFDHQKSRLLNIQTPYLSANSHYFSYPSLMKLLANESQKEEERKGGGEQHKQKLQLQMHNYDYGMRSNYGSGLNPNLSLDWDISSVLPPPSSSAAHKSNLSRGDIDIYGRANWD